VLALIISDYDNDWPVLQDGVCIVAAVTVFLVIDNAATCIVLTTTWRTANKTTDTTKLRAVPTQWFRH